MLVVHPSSALFRISGGLGKWIFAADEGAETFEIDSVLVSAVPLALLRRLAQG